MSKEELRSDLDICLSSCIASSVSGNFLSKTTFYYERAMAFLYFAGISEIISCSEEEFLERALSCILSY